jgi:hypothetical protein
MKNVSIEVPIATGKVAMNPERWQRIEQLYHSARKVDPERRPAFLQDACRGDETVRHEVELLLSSDKYVEGFLETPGVELAARAMAGGHHLLVLRFPFLRV